MTSPGTPTTCSRCGSVVLLAVTQANGKMIALDRVPTEDGTIDLVPAAYGPPVAVHNSAPLAPGETRYRVHMARCRPRKPTRRYGRR